MALSKELLDMDIFFFYGSKAKNLQIEIESDLLVGLIQSRRTMFYNREFGGAVADNENHPSSIALQVMLRYDIATHVARENTKVSDGTDGNLDRRIAVSQSSVSIKESRPGELDVNVVYIPLAIQNIQEISLPVGKSVGA